MLHLLENEIIRTGYPAYTTQIGWLGYRYAFNCTETRASFQFSCSSEKVKQACRKALAQGYTSFKSKVGQNIEDDKRRLALIRAEIGEQSNLMVDANQRWGVETAIDWMKQLAEYRPLWIEEPTSPDDILGHARISRELRPFNIGVATGEQCQNRVIFKQLLQTNAIQVDRRVKQY